MASLPPPPPYSDAELAALYPARLRLQLVQVLLRHGERTPVSARFANTGLPAFWPYCAAGAHLRAAVLDADADADRPAFSALAWRRRLETFGPGDAPVPAAGGLDAVCDMGMLTDRGRRSALQLGQRLRALYVGRLGFLPAALDDDDAGLLYLRATPVPRALDSLHQALHGLYPPHMRSPRLPAPAVVVRAPADETLYPNDGNCRRLAALARAFAQRAADRWNGSDDMALLNAKLARWMPPDSPRVAVDSRPRLSGIMDTINATSAHGPATRLPRDFYHPDVKPIVEKIAVDEWYAGYKESREYRTLGIGALLGDVVGRMVASAEQTHRSGPAAGPASTSTSTSASASASTSASTSASGLRLALSGCHDTTLAAILASLGAFDTDAWPPFTSHVAIELFRHVDPPSPPPSAASLAASRASSSSWPSLLAAPPPPPIGRKPTEHLTDAQRHALAGYYVRIRYNDRPVTVPGCRPPGKHLDGDASFCTLEAFKAIVDKFTPRDWKQQCRANLAAPAFPAEPEPAGY